jgi:hypothetical protein
MLSEAELADLLLRAVLVFRKPHPAKPEIMLIADISSSGVRDLHAAAGLRDQVGVCPGPELRLR